jgi:predicted HAD superfamily Cof-like phosphohydrolase
MNLKPSSYVLVKEFHTAFNQPVASEPTKMERGNVTDRKYLRIMANRLEHTMKDMKRAEYGGRIMQRASWILEELIEFMRADTLVDQVDALTDIRYLTDGTSVEIGVDPYPCIEIVHAANMAKLGPDGKPIIDAQGKVRKPANWEPPEPKLAAEIERQRR